MRALVVVVGLVVLLCAGLASADFSIDAISPDVPAVGEGDVLLPGPPAGPPPAVVNPAAAFGLLPGEELDALSNGVNSICPAGNPSCFTIIEYSVDRATAGIVGSTVEGEVLGNGAAGDIFEFEVSGTGVVITPPSVITDAPLSDLTLVPESSIDALSSNKALLSADYFSIDPASVAAASVRWAMPGLSAADILLAPGPTPTVYATAASLGLVPADDVDGIAIADAPPLGVLSAADVVYITLAPGSPSLTTLPASPADIIQVSPGAPLVIYAASKMGLLPTDNLDAISMIDPPLVNVPSMGPVGMLGASMLIAAFGAVTLWSRREAAARG